MRLIELNRAERKMVEYLARVRQQKALKYNRENRKADAARGDYRVCLEGTGAEWAFCKLFNVYPDTTTEDRILPPQDANLGSCKVDIKVTSYERGHLLVHRSKLGSADVDLYALMVGKYPRYEFRGFATREQLMVEKNIKALGLTPGYALPQEDLFQ